MTKKIKKETVIANFTGQTTDLGAFVKDKPFELPPHLAELAVEKEIARRPDKEPAPKSDKNKKKEEVTDHAK